jgi:tetratricopeptide (TPR) repeat protein
MNRPRPLHRLLFICLAVALLGRTALGAEIGLLDKLAFLALLEQGEFKTLDRQLNAYQEAFEAGAIPDTLVDNAFSTFFNSDPAVKSQLDTWIHQKPKSYAAWAARGHYFRNLGWIARGGEYASRTHRLRFALMHEYFDRAESDYKMAISLKPSLSIAFASLISIENARGDSDAIHATIERGLAAVPSSLMIRLRHLGSLLPWWGGSLTQIGDLVEVTRRTYPDASFLPVVEGFHDYAIGLQLARDDKREAATKYFDRAVGKSDYWWYLHARGKNLRDLGRYKDALAEFGRAIEQRPQNKSLFDSRAFLFWNIGKLEQALEDWERALILDPYNPNTLLAMSNPLRKLKRYKKAMAVLDKAMVHGANDHAVRGARGLILLFGLNRPGEAIVNLRHAIRLRPVNIKYWLAYGVANLFDLFAGENRDDDH